MPSVTAASITEIRCPIDVVRALFGDLEHHISHDVHRNLVLKLRASDERSRGFTQGYRILGVTRRGQIRLGRKADGSLHGKFVRGPSQVPLHGLLALAGPLVKRQLEQDIAKGLEEDRIDLDERGCPRA